MSKNLKTIQSFAKIGKIVSTVCFVFFIIVAIACIIAISTIASIQNVEFNGQTVVGYVESTGTTFVTTIFSLASTIIICAGCAVISKFAEIYFANELEDGTPFTHRGAKEIMRLGLLSLGIPAGVTIALDIAFAVTKHFWPQVENIPLIVQSLSITAGLILIIMSIVISYGAELEDEIEKNSQSQSDN